MRKSRILHYSIFLLLNLAICSLSAQSIEFSVTPIFGSFKMTDMKRLQSEQADNIYDSINTRPSTVYDFPNYWGVGVQASYLIKRHKVDISVGSNATGGRIHYSDYSGQIKADKKVSCKRAQLGYSYAVINKSKFNTSIGLALGMAFSTLKTEDIVEFYVTEEKDTQINSYQSNQVSVSPNLSFNYFPINQIFIRVSAGHMYQLSSSNQQDSDSNISLEDNRGKEITLDWTGFRLGAGIGYRFNFTK